eukprot:8149-Heterococcus_DN1.PRE.1
MLQWLLVTGRAAELNADNLRCNSTCRDSEAQVRARCEHLKATSWAMKQVTSHSSEKVTAWPHSTCPPRMPGAAAAYKGQEELLTGSAQAFFLSILAIRLLLRTT